ncbi:hypothetical protein LSAT2_000890 [Lamellibrachia satsuma]|nr:hypothetical protein LSAT2_000890 [Lamellibrachia satsuma]
MCMSHYNRKAAKATAVLFPLLGLTNVYVSLQQEGGEGDGSALSVARAHQCVCLITTGRRRRRRQCSFRCSGSPMCMSHYNRKAAKATAVLFPLLGLTNVYVSLQQEGDEGDGGALSVARAHQCVCLITTGRRRRRRRCSFRCSGSPMCMSHYNRKAAKATAVLFPLLGLTNVYVSLQQEGGEGDGSALSVARAHQCVCLITTGRLRRRRQGSFRCSGSPMCMSHYNRKAAKATAVLFPLLGLTNGYVSLQQEGGEGDGGALSVARVHQCVCLITTGRRRRRRRCSFRCSDSPMCMSHYNRKATKATAVLFPLLGLTNVYVSLQQEGGEGDGSALSVARAHQCVCLITTGRRRRRRQCSFRCSGSPMGMSHYNRKAAKATAVLFPLLGFTNVYVSLQQEGGEGDGSALSVARAHQCVCLITTGRRRRRRQCSFRCSGSPMCMSHYNRKAAKATAVLFPLLGLTNVFFFIEEKENSALEMAYRVINAVSQSTQGIFISIIYCFMNSEIHATILCEKINESPNSVSNSRRRFFFVELLTSLVPADVIEDTNVLVRCERQYVNVGNATGPGGWGNVSAGGALRSINPAHPRCSSLQNTRRQLIQLKKPANGVDQLVYWTSNV